MIGFAVPFIAALCFWIFVWKFIQWGTNTLLSKFERNRK